MDILIRFAGLEFLNMVGNNRITAKIGFQGVYEIYRFSNFFAVNQQGIAFANAIAANTVERFFNGIGYRFKCTCSKLVDEDKQLVAPDYELIAKFDLTKSGYLKCLSARIKE